MLYPGSIKRIQATFTTETGSNYDPDSQTLKFYDSTATLIATKTQGDCVKVDTGIWYIDYIVPSNAVTGRWICQWTATVTGKGDFTYVHTFNVWSKLWPTIPEVQTALSSIPLERFGDTAEDILEAQIIDAVRRVGKEKGSSATNEDLFQAYLAQSKYLVYVAYANAYERSMGDIPAPVLMQLDRLLVEAERAVFYVRRSTTPRVAATIGQTESGYEKEEEEG